MQKLFWLACVLVALVSIPAKAQQFECTNPDTGQDCGQCYVAGKTCEAPNGRCNVNATCEWCRQIVRTEFCGTLYLSGACWCFALNSEQKETYATTLLDRIRRRNAERSKGA